METVDECCIWYETGLTYKKKFPGVYDNEVISIKAESDIVVKCHMSLQCLTKRHSPTRVHKVGYTLHCVYLASSHSSVGLRLSSTPATHMAV